MRATLMYGAGDVRVENVPESVVKNPTDALVHITASCICGRDLHPYRSMSEENGPARMGHEFIGIVQDTGSEVTTVGKGDLVVAPFMISCGDCVFYREGLFTSCLRGNFWDGEPLEGGQAEAARVPFADGTLVKLDVAADSALIPSLLTLSDVLGTGCRPGSSRAHTHLRAGVRHRPCRRHNQPRRCPALPGRPCRLRQPVRSQRHPHRRTGSSAGLDPRTSARHP